MTNRSGWWTYAAPRVSNGIGIALELPPARAVAWNVVFVLTEAVGVLAAHYVFGVSWWQLAAGVATVLGGGAALLTYVIGARP